MELRVGVFDIWLYRRDEDAIRYLLLETSQEKADRWFNGGRFWQIPCDILEPGEQLVEGVRRCLALYGLTAASVWAAEHVYTIYNRRFDEMQSILVLAAELSSHSEVRLNWEHTEYRWCTADECDGLVSFRGLKEGLTWVRRYVTEPKIVMPELKLA